MNRNEFINLLLTGFRAGNQINTSDVTDRVFLFLKHNEKLMKEYNRLTRVGGTDGLNKLIGRRVRQQYRLSNTGICKTTKSRLIKSYTRH
jgi:hypothetical protein